MIFDVGANIGNHQRDVTAFELSAQLGTSVTPMTPLPVVVAVRSSEDGSLGGRMGLHVDHCLKCITVDQSVDCN